MQPQTLKHYTSLLPFLSTVLGPDYEIALYDITPTGSSLIALYNYTHSLSGSVLGEPLGNAEQSFISQKLYLTCDHQIHYTIITAKGMPLRSSALFLKDDAGQLEGMLCTRFDSSRFQDLSQKLFQLCHPDDYVAKNISINMDALYQAMDEGEQPDTAAALGAATEDIFAIVQENSAVPFQYLTHTEKMDIVKLLQDKGVFLMKGAIPYVAEKLHCSTATVYRYLSKLKKEDE